MDLADIKYPPTRTVKREQSNTINGIKGLKFQDITKYNKYLRKPECTRVETWSMWQSKCGHSFETNQSLMN